MATKEPSKDALYSVFKRLYVKNELGDPHFLLLKSDWQAKAKLYAKLIKNYLERIQSHLIIIFNCEGGYESAPDNLFKLSREFYHSVLITA